MLSLALNTLRHRTAGFIGAFGALLLAAALVGACGILLETGLYGTVAAERYAGAPIVVAGDQNAHTVKHKKGKTKIKSKPLAEHVWVPESVAAAVRSVPGVRAVVPEVNFPAYVVLGGRVAGGPEGTPSWGHSWASAALTPFRLSDGRAPAAPGEVVIDAGLAARAGIRTGSMVTVQTSAAPARYRVAGIATAASRPPVLRRQAAVFFSPQEARRLAGHPGEVAALGVIPAPGVAATSLRAPIGRAVAGTGAKVYTGAARGALEFLDAAKARVMLISLAGTLSGTSLLVAILVVVGTFGLTIRQRHREIALLRAVAATPRQIRAMIGREALIVGIVASGLGCLAGMGVATWLRGRLVDAGAIPANLGLVFGPAPLFAAVGATVIAAWIAARVAARRAIRIRPTEALAEAVAEPARPPGLRLLAGGIVLAGAVVLTVVLSGLTTEPAATPVTFVTSIAWVIATALLGPALVRLAAPAFGLLLRGLSPVSGYLAAANARVGPRRLAAVAMPMTLAVAMTCTILFAQDTLDHAARLQAARAVTADYVLTAPATAPGKPGAVADEVRRVPGVTAVTQVTHTTARGFGLAKYSVQGVTPARLDRTLDLDVRAGSPAGLRADTAAISTNAAAGTGAHLGDRLRLWLGDGTPVTLRVVAIYARGLGFSDLTLSRDLVAAHVDDPLDDSILVKTAPGASARQAAALERAVHGYTGVHVLDRTAMRVRQATQQRVNAKIQFILLGLIIGFTTIASVNTLIMATAGRGREFALLRLIGTTRRQIRRMMRWESFVVTTIAVVPGLAISVITLSAFGAGMTRSAPYLPPIPYLGVIGAAAFLAFTATGVATHVALNNHPAETIGARE